MKAQKTGFTTATIHLAKALALASLNIVKCLVGLLASADKTSTLEHTDNATLGGCFNFRTHKFDDGTDPAGWYSDY